MALVVDVVTRVLMLALAVYLNIGGWEMLALAALLLLFIILRAKAGQEPEPAGLNEHCGGDGLRQDPDDGVYPDWGPNCEKRVGFQAPKRSKP